MMCREIAAVLVVVGIASAQELDKQAVQLQDALLDREAAVRRLEVDYIELVFRRADRLLLSVTRNSVWLDRPMLKTVSVSWSKPGTIVPPTIQDLTGDDWIERFSAPRDRPPTIKIYDGSRLLALYPSGQLYRGTLVANPDSDDTVPLVFRGSVLLNEEWFSKMIKSHDRKAVIRGPDGLLVRYVATNEAFQKPPKPVTMWCWEFKAHKEVNGWLVDRTTWFRGPQATMGPAVARSPGLEQTQPKAFLASYEARQHHEFDGVGLLPRSIRATASYTDTETMYWVFDARHREEFPPGTFDTRRAPPEIGDKDAQVYDELSGATLKLQPDLEPEIVPTSESNDPDKERSTEQEHESHAWQWLLVAALVVCLVAGAGKLGERRR